MTNTSSKGIFYPPAVAFPSDTPCGDSSRPTLNNPTLSGLPLELLSRAINSILRPLGSFLYSNAGFPALRDLNVETGYAGVPELEGPLRGYSPRWDPTVISLANPHESPPSTTTSTEFHSYLNANWSGRFVQKYSLAREDGGMSPVHVAMYLLELIDGKRMCDGDSDGGGTDKRGFHTAWMHVDRDRVLNAARQSTKRWDAERRRNRGEDVPDQEGVRWIDLGQGRKGCLDGVFIGVKDEILVEHHSITYGTGRPYCVPQDTNSWAVQKLIDYGAIVLGTTVMHEFGLDTTNNNPTLGTPLNPFSDDYYPGGSSGGSGSVVGCGLVPIALGADGGGSIRVPSAYCGVFGLKPSHGRVSGWPLVNHCVSTCVLGPIAATMHDLELSYKVMATPNPSDPSSAHFPPAIPSLQPALRPFKIAPARKKYLAIPQAWFSDSAPVVQRMCMAAIEHVTTNSGYTLITPEQDPSINIPFVWHGQLAHALTILNEVTNGAIAGMNGWLSWLTPANKLLMAVSAHATAQDLLLAQKLRALLMSHLAHLFEKYPGLVIVTPTLPDPLASGRIGSANDIKIGGYGVTNNNRSLESMRYVFLANFTGIPAISAPVGYLSLEGKTTKGMKDTVAGGTYVPSVDAVRKVLPVALMGMAEWGYEAELLVLGYELERYLHTAIKKTGPVRADSAEPVRKTVEEFTSPPAWVDVLSKAEEFVRQERT
ncbi:amidase signature domain-containing protein [Tirmania nivea]|nr:amidase signature domain-containing protein [Tirmania nivea]